jgi:hypothetical protein
MRGASSLSLPQVPLPPLIGDRGLKSFAFPLKGVPPRRVRVACAGGRSAIAARPFHATHQARHGGVVQDARWRRSTFLAQLPTVRKG